MQRRVKRTLFDTKQSLGNSLNVECDPESMIRPETQRFENQEFETSLERIWSFCQLLLP